MQMENGLKLLVVPSSIQLTTEKFISLLYFIISTPYGGHIEDTWIGN